MENRRSREGMRYDSRNKKEDKYTYIEEIIVESTGVSKDNFDLFPAAKAKVNRILKRIIEFTGEERLKTDTKFKSVMVRIVKKVSFSEYGAQNYMRMLNKKLKIDKAGYSGGEDEIWSTLAYVENILDIPVKSSASFYENESQEFQEIMDTIVETVYIDMHLVSQLLGDEDKKMELIREYLCDLNDEDKTGFFESWRKEIWAFNSETTKGLGRRTIINEDI